MRGPFNATHDDDTQIWAIPIAFSLLFLIAWSVLGAVTTPQCESARVADPTPSPEGAFLVRRYVELEREVLWN